MKKFLIFILTFILIFGGYLYYLLNSKHATVIKAKEQIVQNRFDINNPNVGSEKWIAETEAWLTSATQGAKKYVLENYNSAFKPEARIKRHSSLRRGVYKISFRRFKSQI